MTKNSLGAAMAKAASRTPHFGRTEAPSASVQSVVSTSQERQAISPSKTERPPSRAGKKVISGYFDPEVSRQLARLQNLYVLPANLRTLSVLVNTLQKSLAGRLEKWVRGGQYEQVFDNEKDTLYALTLPVLRFRRHGPLPRID